MLKKLLALKLMALKVFAVAALGSTLGLAGCNTMEGAGEDLEAGGEAIQNKAEEEKSD